MFANCFKVLNFDAFRRRSDDPLTHYTDKVEGRDFIVAILGHQHIRYTRARFRKNQLVLGKPMSAFCDNFATSEVETPWVAEMLHETPGTRTLLLGLNVLFSNLKIYGPDQKLKDIERVFETSLEEEVGKTFDKQTRYFLSQAGDQICLNGIEREKILKPIEKFKKWGFDIVSVFHYPTSVLARISTFPLDWDKPGMLVYYTQKLIFLMGWYQGEILTVRSKLIAEAQRGGTGARPILNTLQKEIEITAQNVKDKAASASVNIYTYHDRQEQAFAGLESAYKETRPLKWPTYGIISEMAAHQWKVGSLSKAPDVVNERHNYPEPDFGVIMEPGIAPAKAKEAPDLAAAA